MVLQKRLDYELIGYQVPKGSRSARGKSVARKKADDNGMFAFELLATVAGKLLSEEENDLPLTNCNGKTLHSITKESVKEEHKDEEKPLKTEPCDQGSCDESILISDVDQLRQAQNFVVKNHGQTSSGEVSYPIFKNSCVGKSEIRANDDAFDSYAGSARGDCNERHSRSFSGYHEGKVSTLRDLMEEDVKPPALVSSDSSVELPPCPVRTPEGDSFTKHVNNMGIVSRDDDENSSGCTQPSKANAKAYRPQRIGNKRIKRSVAYKYWKAPTISKDGQPSNTDPDMKPVYRNKKMCCTRRRIGPQTCTPFKKRKLAGTSSFLTSEEGVSREYISGPPEKFIKGETTGSVASVHGVPGASSSLSGQKSSTESGEFHVKLNIKSFRVPELFIEIPEDATVGSLKRTVMEAVTAILGGGLRVGVLLQGKKVRDDNKTLLQAGISHHDKIDTLGFTLEPNTAHTPPPLESSEEPALLLPCDAPKPLSRLPASPLPNPVDVPELPSDHPLAIMGSLIESDQDSAPTPPEVSLDKTSPNSQALVPVPAMNVEALAVVPLPRKLRRNELVQRRIRRPFSVSEVEALVQAVEKLGTGRWRDVKLRAFDNAKHRTYVDLKDKWKTLVHTARISPQQRRGEPVPQELLDRVLSSHAYWSQHQAKLHVKQQSEACLLL
ncbi:Telomere repeat-binding protein 4 [Acorus calamus]|uniref:Telomere repeat-binding protein 4 n=1 Tax=Acorus calamus TaxID=4465 RepID=A0AAV9FAQ9_ACOCL|nr:Telomere repeat-binding protein 4 [Acorus calamus]